MRQIANFAAYITALVVIGLAGCQGPQQTESTVYGLVSANDPAAGTVTLRDASSPSTRHVVDVTSEGDFRFDVSELKAPYLIRAKLAGNQTLYAVSYGPGKVSVTPGSTAAFEMAASSSSEASFEEDDEEESKKVSFEFEDAYEKLREVLAPLFNCYNITPENGHDDDAYRAMLRDVKINVADGKLVVTNRASGKVIYSASLKKLGEGVFNRSNLPAKCGTVAPTVCTAWTYSAWSACQANGFQTRTATGTPAGCTGTADQPVSQTCTYTAPACTAYTYSAWGTCSASGVQTRTVTSATPVGCDQGAAVLSQTCTYVPPPVTCTSFTYNAWGACQTNGTQTRTVATSSPAGCTGGSPVLTQTCTYVAPACDVITYSAWGSCQSNNTQTRTVVSATPAGCNQSAAVLSQPCTYVPPVQSCTSCHGAPPATGAHVFHVSNLGYACSSCHGTGYSASAQTTGTTHMNGTVNVVVSNWNATAKTCGGCHGAGSKTW